MNKEEMELFGQALARLLKRFKVEVMEGHDSARIVLYGKDGKAMGSFEVATQEGLEEVGHSGR